MAIESNQSDMKSQPVLNGVGYSELALVHTTSYRPGLDKDGIRKTNECHHQRIHAQGEKPHHV